MFSKTAGHPSAAWMFVQYVRCRALSGARCTRALRLADRGGQCGFEAGRKRELRRLTQEAHRVLEHHPVDQFLGMTAASHLGDELRHGEWLAGAPVTRAGN